MTSEEIKTVVDQVINAAGVIQIVSVDDEYRDNIQVEDILGPNAVLPDERVGAAFAEVPDVAQVEDSAARAGLLRARWKDFSPALRRSLR